MNLKTKDKFRCAKKLIPVGVSSGCVMYTFPDFIPPVHLSLYTTQFFSVN